MKTEFILVETISQHRMRYLVEVPEGKTSWAEDTVTMEQAKEFSQKHLGDVITSSRVISKKDAIKLFKEDNDYLKNWNDEQVMRSGFTTIEELP
jgi:hypothetical protein